MSTPTYTEQELAAAVQRGLELGTVLDFDQWARREKVGPYAEPDAPAEPAAHAWATRDRLRQCCTAMPKTATDFAEWVGQCATVISDTHVRVTGFHSTVDWYALDRLDAEDADRPDADQLAALDHAALSAFKMWKPGKHRQAALDDAGVTPAHLDDMVRRGLLKRNRTGATQLSEAGRIALGLSAKPEPRRVWFEESPGTGFDPARHGSR